MKFHVDAWDPSYGSSVESAEQDAFSGTTARINPDVEVSQAQWKPIPMGPVTEPSAVLFVDGVRRIEARVWIDRPPAFDATTGEIYGSEADMALCASYAAGVVCCCPDAGAHVMGPQSRRGLFTTSANATDVVTTAGTYRVNLTADDPETNLAVLLSAALQRNLADLEVTVAANARADLTAHGVAAGDDLIVIDGPLRGSTQLTRALGYIKSHRTVYLAPAQNSIVSQLKPGERTPVFLMGTSWDRHSWYLRLPCVPGAPWAGVVRVECAAGMPAQAAVDLANLSQAVLPKYASVEYKDTRAPQNLVPIAGLERELRRRLGNAALLTRALRVAAAA